MNDKSFTRTFSKAPWEEAIGYCRTIKAGKLIYVTGTAAIDEDGNTFCPGDPFAQAARCFELISLALKAQGAGLSDVVRTRMFVTDISLWQKFGKAHHKYFHDHPPATSMLEVRGLIDPDMLIEVEADAVLP